MTSPDDRDRAARESWPIEDSTPALVALNTFLQQMGRVMIRVAELETAIERRERTAVLDGMRDLAAEWSLLNADLRFLQAFTPSGGEALTVPAMQIARDHARKVIDQSLVYVALLTANDADDLEAVKRLYLLAEAFSRDGSAWSVHRESSRVASEDMELGHAPSVAVSRAIGSAHPRVANLP